MKLSNVIAGGMIAGLAAFAGYSDLAFADPTVTSGGPWPVSFDGPPATASNYVDATVNGLGMYQQSTGDFGTLSGWEGRIGPLPPPGELPCTDVTCVLAGGSGPELFSCEGAGSFCSTATITTSYSGGKSTISSTTISPHSGYSSASTGEVSFYYEVKGPSSISVPVNVTDSGSTTATASGGGSALSYGMVEIEANPSGTDIACSGSLCPGYGGATTSTPASFAHTEQFSLTSNRLYTVAIITQCETFGDASCSLSFDPMISIDPSFTGTGYSLSLSPDATSADVPEPPSLILLGIGLAGLATTRCKRGLMAELPYLQSSLPD